jgi:hypothetical protein
MNLDLLSDFADVLNAMPEEYPRQELLRLLDEAIRRDLQFIDGDPTTLFQCLWNSCWWHDCPELTNHLAHTFPEVISGGISRLRRRLFGRLKVEPAPQKLHTLLERWRRHKEQAAPGIRWLRSLCPPERSLDGRTNALRGRAQRIKMLDVSLDGTRVVTAFDGSSIGVWSGTTGIMLASLFLHIRGVTNVRFAPDGTWFGGLSYYGREMIAWDANSLKEIRKPEQELSALLFDNSRRQNRYRVVGDSGGAVMLSDSGAPMVKVPPSRDWCSDADGRTWAAIVDRSICIWRLEGDL